MMVIDNRFEIGQTVFIKTDKEQIERMVTTLLVTPIGIRYLVAAGTADGYYFEMELSEEKNILV